LIFWRLRPRFQVLLAQALAHALVSRIIMDGFDIGDLQRQPST
jgi:hypothetical protein